MKGDHMTRILIMSDSHGLQDEVFDIKERHQVDHMIHCGDSELTSDHPALEDMTYVKGNCDYDNKFTYDQVISVKGITIFITHGHMYDVHRSLQNLSYKGEEVDARIICYGHTHIAGAELIDNQLFINPGSVLYSRNDEVETYAILELGEFDKVKVMFYTIKGELVKKLSYEAVFNN